MTPRFFFLVPLLFLYCGCSCYRGNFIKGGELTTDFLSRIEENNDGEDFLLPQKEDKPCSKH